MNNIIAIDRVRREAALGDWLQECKSRMASRWPRIDFDYHRWPLRSIYRTRIQDINFEPAITDFHGKDSAYIAALRCLVAEAALMDEVKQIGPMVFGWRLLARLDVPLKDLKRIQLTGLEDDVVEEANKNPESAGTVLSKLQMLRKHLDSVGQRNVTDRLAWDVDHKTRRVLNILIRKHRSDFRNAKADLLDRQIESLNDAIRSALTGDSRLDSSFDRVCLAAMGLSMCAPSRINEPLCMSVDDRFTLEDYAAKAEGKDSDALHKVHQLFLVKGSKGAAWGAKPILSFMIGLADLCWKLILQNGERSRMLMRWYEENPDQLYLPPGLEHLRGQDIDRKALWQITNLTTQQPVSATVSSIASVWDDLRKAHLIKMIDNPRSLTASGKRNPNPEVQAVAWFNLEPVLLDRVRKAIDGARRVTIHNHYQGRLSNMLFLFDGDTSPYLPNSVKYAALARRLKEDPGTPTIQTVFEKLGIMMVDTDGISKYSWIETHDPRRWLTTQAMIHRETLSNVLINKWANRLNLDQLEHHDNRREHAKADQAAMPAINELSDLSAGLTAIAGIKEQFGLNSEIVLVHDAGISVTSMDAIYNAAGNRPIAKTSNQIIILYPSKYGACLHQHHETPCRAYKCLPCNDNLVSKGHIPSNDAIRERNNQLHEAIIVQIESLLTARQREIADLPQRLDAHILTMVRDGLDAGEIASELCERFHAIKDEIKDLWFRHLLEEAFVARSITSNLDDPAVSSGALIKYHNPSMHAAPGHERAIDEVYGGRAAIRLQLESFERKHPEFSPTALSLKDERYLLEPEDDREDEDDAAQ